MDCPVCYGRRIVNSNCLNSTHPEIARQWHPNKNLALTVFDIGYGSKKKVWWKCPKGEDHIWFGSVQSRTRKSIGNKGPTNCPICSGRKTILSNSLSQTHPHLAAQWHKLLNKRVNPEQVGFGSSRKIWWKCPEGDDHIWKSTINSRTSQDSGCAVCDGKLIVSSNSLATTHPLIANTWHHLKNGNLSPNKVSYGSHKTVWWKCDKHEDHEWKTSVWSRVNRNCPFCSLTPQSRQELIITFELKTLFKRIDPKGYKTRLKDRIRAIDIFIPNLNLCIEFDGSYWHKDKRQIDKIKSNLLLKEGYSVIRVREEPLKKIYDTDVISKQPYDGKKVTNDILSMILSMYVLDTELVERIKDYQTKDELQNEKGLNRYIDKILKEKVDKKLHD